MNLVKAQKMARDLMKYHNLPSDWGFQFDRSLSRLGYCSYRKHVISLGKYATSVNNENEVLNTILHEIAHALIGPGFGHGPVWVAAAKRIGCNGEREGNIEVKAPAKYTIKCMTCFRESYYYRKPKWINNLNSVWCRRCGKEKSKLVLQLPNETGVANSVK